ncbi:tRNA epoxyqueuosine(34) reductase QueG [Alkalilimnicola sp. S0819]|uniref:tRNA epoxyqueuosine(34) reductase QueG n=1 Tax=Alkalilimnicola sp. S0819 TaxID=2613922 RepID=UPI0012624410|nr:tRNA epoxyqueuosine(34) reductase QueG [Alkalilimnicola sp. S0819]KAB7628347.1 tRNA epoxyqueuosine(34) reductase QueG [Alkalilimnicola sp. S0819]MPQ15248.1 tRNA epoxyqueuosine(34) reductase QueG [Alkalilimnicola sp. S0819]
MDSPPNSDKTLPDLARLSADIKRWAQELGFSAAGITDTALPRDEAHLLRWLRAGRHGDMHYMARHGVKRARPEQLHPGTRRVISVRMDYLPEPVRESARLLQRPERGFVSRYALGRDYHKLMRNRLQKLARRMEAVIGPFGYRAFVDSAPVLEKALAEKAGLGWIGKHTVLLNRGAGSYFFLGELFTDLPLPMDEPGQNHCGSCRSCIEVCPTQAIVGPYQLDARRCISYLTIEAQGAIPEPLRAPIGNRVFGCDDCQVFCPWNKFAQLEGSGEFSPRHGLDDSALVELFGWSEAEFLQRTEGSAIRRLGHERWLRNLAVALGNAPTQAAVVEALQGRASHPSALVREHVQWALARHGESVTP